MQRAVLQQTIVTPIHSQATRMIPGHGTGLDHQASNDESYLEESSLWRWLLALLGNVIGGSVLLSTMFVLPHLVSKFLS